MFGHGSVADFVFVDDFTTCLVTFCEPLCVAAIAAPVPENARVAAATTPNVRQLIHHLLSSRLSSIEAGPAGKALGFR